MSDTNPGTNLVQWGEWNMDDAAKQRDEVGAALAGAYLNKLPVGNTRLRILPPPKGGCSPFVTYFAHYVEKPGGGGKVSFACPTKMAQRACPVCVEANNLSRSSNKADQKRAEELRPQFQALCNVVNRAEEFPEVRTFRFRKMIWDGLLELRTNEDMGGNYTHPIDGFDVVITRTGTGQFDTEYKVNAARQNSPLHTDPAVIAAWINSQPDLQRHAIAPSPDELSALLGMPRERRATRTAQDVVDDAEVVE